MPTMKYNNNDWLKRHQELILINEVFEKKFKIEVENKKIFKKMVETK